MNGNSRNSKKPNSDLGGVRPTHKSPYLAITINLSPETSICNNIFDDLTNYDSGITDHPEYQNLYPEHQRDVLIEVLRTALRSLDVQLPYKDAIQLKDNQFIFEYCQDGRVHAHGYIGFPIEKVTEYWCSKITTMIYNSAIMTTGDRHTLKKHALCKVKIIEDLDIWKTYMMKDQTATQLTEWKYYLSYKTLMKDEA